MVAELLGKLGFDVLGKLRPRLSLQLRLHLRRAQLVLHIAHAASFATHLGEVHCLDSENTSFSRILRQGVIDDDAVVCSRALRDGGVQAVSCHQAEAVEIGAQLRLLPRLLIESVAVGVEVPREHIARIRAGAPNHPLEHIGQVGDLLCGPLRARVHDADLEAPVRRPLLHVDFEVVRRANVYVLRIRVGRAALGQLTGALAHHDRILLVPGPRRSGNLEFLGVRQSGADDGLRVGPALVRSLGRLRELLDDHDIVAAEHLADGLHDGRPRPFRDAQLLDVPRAEEHVALTAFGGRLRHLRRRGFLGLLPGWHHISRLRLPLPRLLQGGFRRICTLWLLGSPGAGGRRSWHIFDRGV
mmetsp:Transcript_94487/g.185308  ORF Transcript_94487/g.185308 Transcript_94487/m.185308 type:complete len:357 (-) Transcript_94487:470-1540(-)